MLLSFHFQLFCYGKNEVKIFNTVIKVKLFISKASNNCSKSMDFFQMLLALWFHKKPNKFTEFERKWRKFIARLNQKMSIACRLCRSYQQTSLVFSSSTQDFNQTIHVAPYVPIAFNDNLSFYYFNSLSSVQDVLKGSHHGNFDMVFNIPWNFQHTL